jgi:hypothetical protein
LYAPPQTKAHPLSTQKAAVEANAVMEPRMMLPPLDPDWHEPRACKRAKAGFTHHRPPANFVQYIEVHISNYPFRLADGFA